MKTWCTSPNFPQFPRVRYSWKPLPVTVTYYIYHVVITTSVKLTKTTQFRIQRCFFYCKSNYILNQSCSLISLVVFSLISLILFGLISVKEIVLVLQVDLVFRMCLHASIPHVSAVDISEILQDDSQALTVIGIGGLLAIIGTTIYANARRKQQMSVDNKAKTN